MKFKVLNSKKKISQEAPDCFYLIEDKWDDWFKFETLYYLYYLDKNKNELEIGAVKIGQKNQASPKPLLPNGNFKEVGTDFFSLGQDDSYYESLNNLFPEMRIKILKALNDLAYNVSLFEAVLDEEVVSKSLLRTISEDTVRKQFHRITTGGARLTHYDFSYRAPYPVTKQSNIELSFEVIPESNPPTNIHVLIGRNGVGKTHLLNNMIMSLMASEKSNKWGNYSENLFVNLVLVSFSAFDQKYPATDRAGGKDSIRYTYVGLSRPPEGNKILPPKGQLKLRNEFVASAFTVSRAAKGERWKNALLTLESDPIFKEADISTLCEIDDKDEFKTKAEETFHKLSSGHKIVLLTITRLVETVDEKTLVLLDEPECHLHPPLLSAFIRALSDLLVQRNGVAIIATHSPVVLQEVPKSCVWKIVRRGLYTSFSRLSIESFGENIGVLSSEVFGLELSDSGYHNIISNVANNSQTYDLALQSLRSQLGGEGRAVLRSMINMKGNDF